MSPNPAPRHALDLRHGSARHSPDALTLDALRAVRGLGLEPQDLQAVLRTDAATVGGLLAHELALLPASREGRQALLLIRLHRALGDVFGSLDQAHEWLDAFDPELEARPRDLARDPRGLATVVEHIGARCRDCL